MVVARSLGMEPGAQVRTGRQKAVARLAVGVQRMAVAGSASASTSFGHRLQRLAVLDAIAQELESGVSRS